MKFRGPFLLALIVSLAFGCKQVDQSSNLIGEWIFFLDIRDEKLPFEVEIKEENQKLRLYVNNGEERIEADEFEPKADSLFIQLPIFNTELIGRLNNGTISGNFYDYSRDGNYHIPFSAHKHSANRFVTSNEPIIDVTGNWKVKFSPESNDEYAALGVFKQQGNRAFGTFLTTTGDYRYLEGNVSGDSLFLSCFDGSHAFLFKAKVNDSIIVGSFWSGNHWKEKWTGVRDESYELPNPNALTFLKPGYSKLDFSFENLEGNKVSLDDSLYRNKVVIVQLMGSWCPNCMDETAYLVQLHKKFNNQGLEIISLAFERGENQETIVASLNRLKNHFDIPYQILLAGNASKTAAAEKLPMLNHVLSFPTSIFIDRKGEVRRIHTGFTGPGTAGYYKDFVEGTDEFLEQLLLE